MSRGLFIVVSAPSGAGKSTLCDRLLETNPEIRYSVSCTTRAPRGEEKDGVDYHFLTEDTFIRRRDAGDFIEWAEVHGCFYGTPVDQIDAALSGGNSIIMDIDVQGAAQIRSKVEEGADFEPLEYRSFASERLRAPRHGFQLCHSRQVDHTKVEGLVKTLAAPSTPRFRIVFC